MSADSVQKTIGISLVVALVSSILVSTTVVALKDIQEQNKVLDKKKNVLAAAGLLSDGVDIEKAFKKITPILVSLKAGTIIEGQDAANFDMKKAAKDPAQSIGLDAQQDIAGIRRIAKLSQVYLVKNDQNEITKYIFPVYGKGLWSTMYGFLALDKDLMTVRAFTFYEHGETPGLGGEVDNPNWKKNWEGKKALDENGNVILSILKGMVDPNDKEAYKKIDGLSGSTLTKNGVENLVKFWLGESGFGPFIDNLRNNKIDSLGGNS